MGDIIQKEMRRPARHNLISKRVYQYSTVLVYTLLVKVSNFTRKEKEMEEDIVEEITYIREEDYQIAKKTFKEDNDYCTNIQLNNLMQFLMQRQRKNIKNEEKRNKIQNNQIVGKCLK